MRAAIYCRVSTGKQAKDGVSLDDQERRCREFVSAKGWTVAEVYKDAGYSGYTIERAAYQDLIADMHRGAWEVVVCLKSDRIHRNAANYIRFRELMDIHGKDFAFYMEAIDTTTALGRLTADITMRISQYEVEVGQERTMAALAERHKQGRLSVPKLPWGMWRDDSGVITMSHKDRALVRLIFHAALSDSAVEISTHYPEVMENDLDSQAILKILKSPIYAGWRRYKGEWIEIDKSVLPFQVVSPELYNDVQRALHERGGRTSMVPLEERLIPVGD